MSELTVIVPSWNQKELLRNCLLSLQKQTAPCRILIVDNGSTDSTAEMVSEERQFFPTPLEYINLGSNLGFARAVNEGIQSSRTEFVALLNNDTEADTRWVEVGLCAFVEFPDYAFFASRIINYYRRTSLDSAGDCCNRQGIPYKRGFGQPVEAFSQIEPVLGASAAAAFYRRALFEEIGFFDEGFFMYLEDVDFSLRAQLRGRRCLYLPEAIVYHIEAASDPGRRTKEETLRVEQKSKGAKDGLWSVVCGLWSPIDNQRAGIQSYCSSRRVYWITRNRWQLMITYQPLRHLPWLLYGWVRSAFFHLLKGGCFGSFLQGLLAGLLRTPQALKKRIAI
ncbi:glycosyltransferase family 2 protein, partial [Acidobacteria bacterium AH-259-O06]|nr:glycosyltransferase family 2 protein [Acidobacteria bacterium AH-259-O06]